jgi:hypothetical protein
MSDLRVPKHKVAVEVILPGGATRRMAFFLAEAALDHHGPERPLDLLNGDDDFLPAFDEGVGAMTFLHRKGVHLLRVDRAHDAGDDSATLPTEFEVEVQLADGTAQRGLVSFVRPPDHSRLVDALNEATPFFRLLQGDQVAYVNKRHVALITLAAGSQPGPGR